MEKLEKVEKLIAKTGVSYEEAKKTLEECDYDLLDAMVLLEQRGKIASPKTTSYTTTPESERSEQFAIAQKTYENDCNGTSAGEMLDKFCKWCGKIIKRCCEINFNVVKQEKKIISMPIIVLILVGLVTLPLLVILLIVGLFTDCKYYFDGVDSTKVDINEFCEKASETCESIKSDFKNK